MDPQQKQKKFSYKDILCKAIETIWTNKDYIEWLKKGSDPVVASKVLTMDISNAQRLHFNNIHLFTNLKSLKIIGNITHVFIPETIKQLKNLEILNLCMCMVPNDALFECTALIDLKISSSFFVHVHNENHTVYSYNLSENIQNLTNLKNLYVKQCSLSTIPTQIGNLKNLQYLDLSNNSISVLPTELSLCENLVSLNMDSNILTTFPIELLILQKLKLINVKTNYIINENLFDSFKVNGTVIEYSLRRRLVGPGIINVGWDDDDIYYTDHYDDDDFDDDDYYYVQEQKFYRTTYDSSETVHDSGVQTGLRQAITYLLTNQYSNETLSKVREKVQSNDSLNNIAKQILLSYLNSMWESTCLDDRGIRHKFWTIAKCVYSTVENNIHKEEIFNIMNKELEEGIYKCQMGRLSRLVNCLSGFDENVLLGIDENSQISNIITNTISKLRTKNIYTKELCKETVTNDLISRGFDQDVVNEWIQYIE